MPELHHILQDYVAEYKHFTDDELEMELVKVTTKYSQNYNTDRSVAIRGIQVARKKGYPTLFGVKLKNFPHIPEDSRMTVFHATRK